MDAEANWSHDQMEHSDWLSKILPTIQYYLTNAIFLNYTLINSKMHINSHKMLKESHTYVSKLIIKLYNN